MNGFSEDGYIVSQDYFSDYVYRTISSDINGCGWMAAYNLLRALGETPQFDDVRAEMDGMHTRKFPGPTLTRVMREYLIRYVPGIRETRGRRNVIRAMNSSRAGILRYYEEGVPHFVAYMGNGEGRFRFFNVNDGMEDFTDTPGGFAKEHFKGGSCLVFSVEAPPEGDSSEKEKAE